MPNCVPGATRVRAALTASVLVLVGFAGTERDAETKIGSWDAVDYVGARYYASQTGRFTSVDPGHVSGNILDPQSWNGYAYARNNPLTSVDPSGLRPCKITLAGPEAEAAGLPAGTTLDGECEQVSAKAPRSLTGRMSEFIGGVLAVTVSLQRVRQSRPHGVAPRSTNLLASTGCCCRPTY